MPNVRVLLRTTCAGIYDHGVVAAVERLNDATTGASPVLRERYWRIRAAQIVLATGAIEQPAVFPRNDLPGVMLAGAVRRYLNRYAVACGRRVAIVTNDDEAYRTALDLAEAGVAVAAIVDSRASAYGAWPKLARDRGLPIFEGSHVRAARGGSRVRSLSIVSAHSVAIERRVRCRRDVVGLAAGAAPLLPRRRQAQLR